MYFRLILLFSCFSAFLPAQTDSSLLLKPERLTRADIQERPLGKQRVKMESATRSLEEVDRLPFSVWVITAEDILRNGFVTLGDVLKAAPGMRVSQVGNTLEGETFMVRGLSGNQYMKVLINDVPVSPSVAKGMPIGAQLPIRQAERIEVFYGPAAAIYGDGALAGVVNIVLKETERPIFTQADLSFGNLGYNNLDLMLGGKLFKDQKIFRFSLYGSSTVRSRTDIFYDDSLFAPQKYLLLGLDSTVYLFRPNFRSNVFGEDGVQTAEVPHESRLLGINLTWRGIHFNYNRMQRFDHSALGLSPLAASYANPSNRIAERIETFAIGFRKQRPGWTVNNTLSVVRYQVDKNSNFSPVFDHLGTALYYAKRPSIQSDSQRTMVLNDISREYAFNERYFAANGLDIRFESRYNFSLGPRLYCDAGGQLNIGGGAPPTGYFIGPTSVRLNGDNVPAPARPFSSGADGVLDFNQFIQLHWRGKKLNVVGGTALNLSLFNDVAAAPRLAAQYHLDSTWTLRAVYAEGFRRPSVYARVNTYRIDTAMYAVQSKHHDLDKSEHLRSAEFGVQRNNDGFITDLSFFYQEADHLIRDGYLTPDDTVWQYGYQNAPGQALSMWGIQGMIGNDVLDFDLNKNKPQTGEITLHAEFYFQYTRGREWFGWGLPATNDVRNFPRWITQFRMSLRAPKWEFILSSNRQNAILSSSAVYRNFFERDAGITHYPAYRTWDVMLRVFLSKNFLVYINGRNIFNRHYAGIDATGTPDDLLYNPQQGRLLRFGVSYNMN